VQIVRAGGLQKCFHFNLSEVYARNPVVLPGEKRLYGASRTGYARQTSPPRSTFIDMARLQRQGQPSAAQSARSGMRR
jgi:hypothetical protein